ncbi:MAG: sugar ABC transporter permease [Anaerolineae bacterium]|nr:sugar ABC transporter permease [Anaerolineae bacterium]
MQKPYKQTYLLDNEKFLGFSLLLPAVLYILLLVGVPFALSIVYSFSDVTIGDQSVDFAGFDTYKTVLENPVFQRALGNNFRFTIIAQVLVTSLSLILALVLAQDFPGKWIFRFLLLLPWVTPIAIGTIGWLYMLDTIYSPIDYVLREVGILGTIEGKGALVNGLTGTLQDIGIVDDDNDNALRVNCQIRGEREICFANMQWLGQEETALASVILVHVWRMLPLSTIIILAGLTSIPQDIKDAVSVDGVGRLREFFEVTLPLIGPITGIATLFGLIYTFTDVTVVAVLTKGGPANHTQVLPYWAYLKGVQGTNLAEGAAIALFMFPVLLAVAVLVLTLIRRREIA